MIEEDPSNLKLRIDFLTRVYAVKFPYRPNCFEAIWIGKDDSKKVV